MFALAVGVGVVFLAWHRISSGNASQDDAQGDDER
jgi:hypothetical protein